MISPRWRKVLRDISLNKGRSLMVIAAITVGIIATGSILNAYSVITREMDRNFQDTNPPSAIFHIDSIEQDLVDLVKARPDIASAEARRELVGRLVLGSGEWIDLQLIVVSDFDDLTVSTFRSDTGAWNPKGDEILIERSSLKEVDLSIGDRITVTTPGRDSRVLSVTGLVHDPGRTPAWMTGIVVGYISLDGLTTLGLEPTMNELRIITANGGDRAFIRSIAEELRTDLLSAGVDVRRVDVPVPGEHPAQSVMTTMLFVLQSFGLLTLVASGALVATLITAQLKQQSREIGVMKSIGAQRDQIAGIYLGTVALLSLVGLAIGIPLGILGSRGFIAFTFGLLNFEVESYKLDAWVLPLQIVIALIVPLLAAAYPVLKTSRLPAREVISDHGIAADKGALDSGLGLFNRMQWLGRTNMFGIRNAFRTRSRTMLTMLALSLGGAAFMVALNTGTAWDRVVDDEFDARRYTAEIQLDRGYSFQQIDVALEDVPQIDTIELWNLYPAAMQLSEGGTGESFRLLVPPDETQMIDYPVIEGRWLRSDDVNTLVVTQLTDDPTPIVGGATNIDIDGVITSWTVVGIVRQLSGGQSGVVYGSNSPNQISASGIDSSSTANHIRYAGDSSQSALTVVEDRLGAEGIGVVAVATAIAGRQALDDHLLIIVGLLLLMAILISIVGGLGLIEAMSISVLERRREIGVMRALGAGTGKVLQVVLIEGILISTLSWIIAIVLSVPATLLVESITGQIFFQAPLTVSFSSIGVGLWLAITVVLASIASVIPALETTEIPVHEALAYE